MAGTSINPGDLRFTTREYYLEGGDDYSEGQTLSFEQLDTTLIFLSNSIATAGTSFVGLTTASVNLNTINFSKSNGTTFSITIDTGSAATVNTGSLLLTASAILNTIEFTKGDGTTKFYVTIDTGSGQTYLEGPGIDINSNYISASIGAGLRFDNNSKIEATVRTVNGATPDTITGNITTALTAVLTGPSSSNPPNNLIGSSSGAATGSIANATVWVVSGDSSVPDPDGLAYIFVSQSVDAGGYGKWFPLSTLNQDQADLRYVKLVSTTQTITSSLLISGSTTFSGSLFWSGASNLGGAINNVLVLGTDGKLYVTGAYGSGGGGATPGGADTTIQFNDGGATLSGSGNFTFNKISNTVNLSGSLIVTGSTILSSSLQVIGTSRVTGSLIVSNSFQTIGTGTITGSLIVSSSSQIIGTETITGSLIVSSSSNVIGTSRVTGSLIVSNSLQVIGTGSITGSLTISSSTNGQNVLRVIGTGSLTSDPLVQIAGQNGGFVQIYDSNSGSLFSVNNNTGTAIVDVRSNGQTLIGSNTFQGMYDSTANIAFASPSQILTLPGYLTSSYNALWFDYVVFSSSYSRMGTLYSVWSGSNISWNDETGSYNGTVPANNITLVTRFSSSFVQITASAATNNWVIKGMIRCI